MKLVKNERKYWEFIRNLRNHTKTKEGFIDQGYITPEDHMNYMFVNANCFYVCLDESAAECGYVRVIKNDISVATHPNFRRQGVGKFMIDEIMKIHPNAYAKVKIENEASMALFESCAFVKKYYILERENV